jgi:hypothetical protein
VAVVGDLERFACEYAEHAQRFLARAMRLRQRGALGLLLVRIRQC